MKKKNGTTNWATWTAEEDEILRAKYPLMGLAVAELLPRHTLGAIRSRISQIGLDGARQKPWTEEEIEILKKWFPVDRKKAIELLPNHTKGSIGVKATTLGVTCSNRTRAIKVSPAASRKSTVSGNMYNQIWTTKENNILRKYYPTEGARVSERLNGRTESACVVQASIIGVTLQKNDARFWTDEEKEVLRSYYPVEGEDVWLKLDGRTKNACVVQAHKMHLESPRREEVWSIEDLCIFMNFFPKEKFAVMNRMSGNHKSRVCERLAYYLGYLPTPVDAPRPRWTEGEDTILAEKFPVEKAETCRYLPRRTRGAVCTRGYSLWRGTRPRSVKQEQDIANAYNQMPVSSYEWTAEELSLLVEFYPEEGGNVFQRMPGKTRNQCYQKAHSLGLRKKKKARPFRAAKELFEVYEELLASPLKGMRMAEGAI